MAMALKFLWSLLNTAVVIVNTVQTVDFIQYLIWDINFIFEFEVRSDYNYNYASYDSLS